jgi:hypothetical protein
MDGLSLIRLLGLAAGILILAVNFLYHRGTRWSRSAFLLASILALGLIVVSLDPSTVNGLPGLLSLGSVPYGRLLSLTVLSSFGGILLALYAKARADHLHRLLDRIVCADTTERALSAADFAAPANPICIVIAALNEETNLEQLLPRIPRWIDGTAVDVLVVDDGSSDATVSVARRHGCLTARNSVNRGQGAALRVGYMIARARGAQIVVTMDADNQHRPEDLPVMVEPLLRGSADFVIGSRQLGGADAGSKIRSLGVVLFSRLITVLSGRHITDCSSGFRAFRIAAMAKLELREDQYQTSEVIIEASKKGLNIVEVPIHITLRLHGESRKGRTIRYGFFFMKSMVKTWWR